MICPKCGSPHYHYKEKRVRGRASDKKWKRTNFETICGKCGHSAVEGVVKK